MSGFGAARWARFAWVFMETKLETKACKSILSRLASRACAYCSENYGPLGAVVRECGVSAMPSLTIGAMHARQNPLIQVALVIAGLWGFEASSQVYRCGNTYTHEPCKGGRTVDTSPAVASHGGSGSPSMQTIYLCRSKAGGGMFWTTEHCHQANAWVERTESVPKNMNWENQLSMAKGQRAAAEAMFQPPPQNYAQQDTQPQVFNNKQTCTALDQRVKDLDSMGRAGSLHFNLDWIRAERKVARDEQFRLRC